MRERLKVKEIYPAVIGESAWAGFPGLIVRLAGCNLRCSYCDTRHAYSGGRTVKLEDLIKSIGKHGLKRILLTGGEPLLQPAAFKLLDLLVRRGFSPLVETNGSIDLSPMPQGVHVVMDLKTPGSGHAADNLIPNFDRLKPTDDLKIVLVDRKDYAWAKVMIREHAMDRRFQLILSPAFGKFDARELVRLMLRDKIDARLGLQLHKYLFGARARKV